jgi:hypothetical protein
MSKTPGMLDSSGKGRCGPPSTAGWSTQPQLAPVRGTNPAMTEMQRYRDLL